MGLNALRISVEWSRIEPAPGEFDAGGAGEVRGDGAGCCASAGIEPMVTLHHFTDPIWLGELGGWENPLIGDYFSRFTERVVDALGDQVNLWCTINEPLVYAFYGFHQGLFPPGGAEPAPRADASCATCCWRTAARIARSTGFRTSAWWAWPITCATSCRPTRATRWTAGWRRSSTRSRIARRWTR